jgi:hypothetical protein
VLNFRIKYDFKRWVAWELTKKKRFIVVIVVILSMFNSFNMAWVSAETKTQVMQQPIQKRINKIQDMPSLPSPFIMKDWRQIALGYDQFVYDFSKTGEYLPVGWWDKKHNNVNEDTFGLMSYVGKFSQGSDGSQEAINLMASVLSATLVGVDKSNQNGHNYVKMLQTFYNKDNGENVILNNPKAISGQSFWYELLPQILFSALTYYYPNVENMQQIMQDTADKTAEAVYELGGKYNRANFHYTAYDYHKKEPFINDKWTEPDAAAGMALLEYWAYAKFKDPKYLEAARWSMDFLQREQGNPSYEVLSYYAPYMAARMNAELNESYDIDKMINWVFSGGSEVRDGWGVMSEKWGDYDVHGLMGNVIDNGGYAFAMNTFSAFGSLAPIVRYDTRYARDIGKWMLNVANNSRLFYADSLPSDHQSGSGWLGDPQHVIPYEGLRKLYKGQSPFASGDPTVYSWGNTDFSLYSGSYVGLLGGLIQKTNIEGVLQIDCLKSDYFHEQAYPTYLVYNPYETEQKVEINGLGSKQVDLYDTVTGQFLARNVSDHALVSVLADNAAVILVVPTNKEFTVKDHKIWMDGIYVSAEAKPAVNIVSMQHKQLVEGILPLHIEAFVPGTEKFKEVRVTFAGQEIYNKSVPPKALVLDTLKYSNGFHKLSVTVTTNKGKTDSSQLDLLVRNEGGAALLTADAKQLASWNPIEAMPGAIIKDVGKTIITEANPDGGYGGVSSPTFQLDFSRKPIIVVDVDKVLSKWTLQVHIQGEKWGLYVKPDGPETGHFVIDVMKEMHRMQPDLPYLGVQTVELWLIAAGKEGANVAVKRLDMFYQDDSDLHHNKWVGKRSAVELLDWSSIDSMAGSVIVANGEATIREENILNRGGIASPVMAVDFDENPVVSLDIVDAKKEWSLLLYKEGAREGYVIQQPTSSLGKQSFDIRSIIEKGNPAIAMQGIQRVKLWLVAEGDNKTTVTVRDLELTYAASDRLLKLNAPIVTAFSLISVLCLGMAWFYKRRKVF